MPIQTHQFDIKGVRHDVTDFGGVQNLHVARRLIGLLGPSFAKGMSALQSGMKVEDIQIGEMSNAVEALLANLNSTEAETVIKLLCGQVTVYQPRENGTFPLRLVEAGFDEYFAGPQGIQHMPDVVKLMLEHSFAPFVRGLFALLGK